MENIVRKILMLGTATLVLVIGAVSANARQQARPFHRPSLASVVQEGRAASIRESFPARYFDNGYHDPTFSRQQDEIYEGRF
jgi:hypothetical protein